MPRCAPLPCNIEVGRCPCALERTNGLGAVRFALRNSTRRLTCSLGFIEVWGRFYGCQDAKQPTLFTCWRHDVAFVRCNPDTLSLRLLRNMALHICTTHTQYARSAFSNAPYNIQIASAPCYSCYTLRNCNCCSPEGVWEIGDPFAGRAQTRNAAFRVGCDNDITKIYISQLCLRALSKQ